MFIGDPAVDSGFPITSDIKTDPTKVPWNTNAKNFVQYDNVEKMIRFVETKLLMRNALIYPPNHSNADAIDYGGLGDYETHSHLLQGLGGIKYD